jgi:hypothetical protein
MFEMGKIYSYSAPYKQKTFWTLCRKSKIHWKKKRNVKTRRRDYQRLNDAAMRRHSNGRRDNPRCAQLKMQYEIKILWHFRCSWNFL